jgi:predicted alpha-1,2-mannosidase
MRIAATAKLLGRLVVTGLVVGAAPTTASLAAADPTSAVDPFQGTQSGAPDFGTGGGAGNTFPGATVPHGMVQFSPDTFPSTDNFASGYSYEDSQIKGFSLNHVSGGGCAELQDVPIVPVAQSVTSSPQVPGSYDLKPPYQPSFSHAHESAAPGMYSVTLNPGTKRAVGVELTATTRTGDARLRFPVGSGGSVLINGGGSAMGDLDVRQHIDPSAREVTGSSESGYKCYQHSLYRVYFAARFSAPFATYGTWGKSSFTRRSTAVSDAVPDSASPPMYKPIPGGPARLPGDPTSGAQAGSYVTFAAGHRPIEVRIGVSYVSVGDARANLNAEVRGRSFDQLRADAHKSWSRRLSQIEISGATGPLRQVFYTALYHALLMPNVFSDVGGAYRGMDGLVHRTAGTEYANYSGWDIYRSQFPLLALLEPAATSRMVRSLLDEGDQSSGQLPKWPLLGTQNNVMVGDPADPLIAGAYAFGARDFDLPHALAAMSRGATKPGRSANNDYVERAGLTDYERLGYVPFEDNTDSAGQTFHHELAWGSSATTLEYALDDFAIARLARSAGRGQLCRTLAARSGNWTHVFNGRSGYVQPRWSGGQWARPADPSSGVGFAEGNSAQYSWFVPHDFAGLIRAMGGSSAARGRLNSFFTRLNAGYSAPYAFLGNEPTLQTPYIYNWLRDPSAGATIVHRALRTLYHPTPTGYPGNDDAGEMSSWWVLSALGMYPAIPGTGVLTLTAPLFPHAVLHLRGGDVVIEASGARRDESAIASLTVDGARWNRTWLTFENIARGAHLSYRLTRRDGGWGTGAGAAPPSFSTASVCR